MDHGREFDKRPERSSMLYRADAAGREEPGDTELRGFYGHLHRMLPQGFLLNEDVPCIHDDKGQKVSAPIRAVSHARRPDGTG
ncbi:MAG TPA: hypothetical protein PKA35_12675 [Paracoccus solventivorans]|uniref:hypothetical protein n=1 Tax=Paracoccus solventivorans TaxID=53463 RepID=UPI002C3BC997|nr:hypothetical protein [Paracoccus solventivorans]HMM09955.1 hypothetical protein [Paracoccus solventivorans]